MVLFPKEKVPYSTWYFFLLVLFPSIRPNSGTKGRFFLGHPVQELSIRDNYFHDAVLRLGVACQSGLWSVVGEIRS